MKHADAYSRAKTAVFLLTALAIALALAVAGSKESEAYPATTSCYGAELAGSPTASGVPFDPSAFTAAHKGYPLGTVLGVRSYDTGAYVEVTINDRGPYVADREVDLSCGAMGALGLPVGVYAMEVTEVYVPY